MPHPLPTYSFPLLPLAPADAHHSRRSEASLLELRDGTVLCAYGRHTGPNDPGYARLVNERIVRYGGGSAIERDNDFGEIVAVRLDAAGQPLTSERVIVPAPNDGLNSMSPALRRLPDGRIGMLYSHRQSTRIAERRWIVSSDEGETWSAPVTVMAGGYKTGCHDRFTILAGDRLIAPCHGGDDFDSHYRKIWVAWSDDAGATWQHGDEIALPQVGWPGVSGIESGCNEPGIVERADGSLLMTMRTAMGTQFCSESFDRGETWSSPRTLEVPSPSAPAHLSRLPGGNQLLLVWNPNYDSRTPMQGHRHTVLACVSDDGGKSWPHARRKVLVHDVSRNTDYPVVLFRDREAWIAFRQSDHPHVIKGRMSTTLMRVPLAWFTS
jgi:BNR/Asp-box repeat.